MTAERVTVRVRLLDPEMKVPSYAHPGDAGADLAIAHDVEIAPGQRMLVGPASPWRSRTAGSVSSIRARGWRHGTG